LKVDVSSTRKGEFLKLSASLAPLREKDFESTGYSSDPKKNEKLIGEFLTEWVHEPFSREAAKGGPRRSRPSLGTRHPLSWWTTNFHQVGGPLGAVFACGAG
jgi:hypothetical protein